MKCIQKQAMIKLAQVRLAINHVLRQRMVKKAEIDHLQDAWKQDYAHTEEATWPKNYAPWYGANLPPLDENRFRHPNPTFEPFPEFQPTVISEENKNGMKQDAQDLNNYRKTLYKTKWKKIPTPNLYNLITGNKHTVPEAQYPSASLYTSQAEYPITAAENLARKKQYDETKKQYNAVRKRYDNLTGMYRTLKRVDQLDDEWDKELDELAQQKKELWGAADNILFSPHATSTLSPELNAKVQDLLQFGVRPDWIPGLIFNDHPELLSDNLKNIKSQIDSINRQWDDTFERKSALRNDEELRTKIKNKVSNELDHSYEIPLVNDAQGPYSYSWTPETEKARNDASLKYRQAQKSKYMQDLNTYRSIYNMQHGLLPQTPLKNTVKVTQPRGKNSTLSSPLYYRSPITGKHRLYTYDAINNPYYEHESPFGDQPNFEQHYPRMVKQWAKQDKQDRRIQKFNQAVDKVEPLMGTLSGKWKPIFNAASLARQGVKTRFPEYWQRPKHLEENGIYTEY